MGGSCVAFLGVLIGLLAYVPKIRLRMMDRRHRSEATEPFWPGGYNLRNVSGIPVGVAVSTGAMDKWKTGEFVHRPTDAWVTSYPKSGTTLAQVIVMSLFNRTFWSTAAPDLILGCPTYDRRDSPDIEPYPNPRCLKSHWQARDHLTSPGRGRVIWVTRHVADVAKSFHNFWNQLRVDIEGEEPISLEVFERLFLEGVLPYGSWFEHFESYWKQRHDPNVYMLRYEDLRRDRRAAIEGLAKFLGGNATEFVDNAFHASEFEQMKITENRRPLRRLAMKLGTLQHSRLRMGQTGEGKNSFSPEFMAALEKKYTEILEPLGVPREYVF